MAVFVERLRREKSLCTVCDRGENHDQKDQAEDVSRHGYPASWVSSFNVEVMFNEIRPAPIRRRQGSPDRTCRASTMGSSSRGEAAEIIF
jgi:hypothetical protein